MRNHINEVNVTGHSQGMPLLQNILGHTVGINHGLGNNIIAKSVVKLSPKKVNLHIML